MLDTDQDGDDDIILGPANGPSSDMLLINDGDGFFELQENAFPTRYQGIDGQTVNITSADFNNDGRPDIIASTIDGRECCFSQSAQIHIYLNGGDNTFSNATNQIIDNLFAQGWVEWIRVGDFNNDGNMDFVTTSAGLGFEDLEAENFVAGYIYLNDGNANFSRTNIRMNDNNILGEYTNMTLGWDIADRGSIERRPLDLFVGDVDNDGDDDIVASNGFAGGEWPTFLNISSGTEASFEIVLNGNSNEDPFDELLFKNGALMDINGDGFLDVIGSTSISGGPGNTKATIETFLNDGTGKFSEDIGIIGGTAPGVDHARQWLVADFNNDGKDDLFVADHSYDAFPFPGFPNTLLLSAAGSLTNNSSNVGNASAFTHGAAVGDIDNNGSIDLFMNNQQGLEDIGGATSDSYIFLNNGSGVLTGAN